NRVSLTWRPFHLRQSLRHWNSAEVANTPRSLRTSGHSIMWPTGNRPQLSPFGKIPEFARAAKQRETQKPFVNRSLGHHELHFFSRRSAAPDDLISSNRKE